MNLIWKKKKKNQIQTLIIIEKDLLDMKISKKFFE